MATAPAPAPAPADAEVAAFRREGWLVLPALLGPEDLRRIDEDIAATLARAAADEHPERLVELEEDGRAPRRIYEPHLRLEACARIAGDARLVDPIARLLGPDLGLHYSKINMKPARVGAPVEWHQDHSYFPHTNPDLLAALIYLDDADRGNGCLRVLPRRHHEHLDHADAEGRFVGMIRGLDDAGAVDVEAPAGSVVLMHCMTPHASAPNLSERARRTLIFGYRAADAYPILTTTAVVDAERGARIVRGRASPTARLAGPPAPIPRPLIEARSLFELQRAARER